MSLKSYFSFIFVGVFIVFANVASFAQFAPVSGTVELVKADGTREPVIGAVIDVYRTDIKAGFPQAKTGKKGEFAFAGIPLGGTFTFAVSAPNCSPTIFPNVRAGQEKLVITMSPGDGSKISEADARKGAAVKPDSNNTGTAELTAEQKKAQAEFEKKNAEITDKNTKIKQNGEIVARTLKEGNEAYTAKNYDLAIAKYSEGIVAEPDFVGSSPVLLNNRGAAYNSRAVDTYNKSVKSPDVSTKVAGLTATRKDFTDATASFTRAWEILKNALTAEIVDQSAHTANKNTTVRGIQETFRLAVLTEQVEPTLIEAAKVMIPEYLNVETDAAKKVEANLVFADLYRLTGDFQSAVDSYKKVLAATPNSLEAMWGGGNCLIALGVIGNNDKALLQEGVDFLQKFVNAAPDTNKYKTETMGTIESIKKEQNVAPQKSSGGKKKP